MMAQKRDLEGGSRTVVVAKPALTSEVAAGLGQENGSRADVVGAQADDTPVVAPPRGATGVDLALHYAMEDSRNAGDGEELQIVQPQFGEDDGTGDKVHLLRLNQSVVYSLLIRKRYPAGVRAQRA